MRTDYATDGDVFLSRWWLLGSEESRYALMVHKFWRPDRDLCHHDHPWSFLTLVLRGGYVEETPTGPRYARPGSLLWRPAEWRHRVASLPFGPAWTLVFRMPKRREWGFWTQDGWVAQRTYFAALMRGVAWCGYSKSSREARPTLP